MTLRVSDLQWDSDLDSLRNCCDVFIQVFVLTCVDNAFCNHLEIRDNFERPYCVGISCFSLGIFISSLTNEILSVWANGRENKSYFEGNLNFTFSTKYTCTFISSVRSSYSHPDLLEIQQHHPLFQITPVLNTRSKLSEPLQLYQRQSLDSFAGYMYTLWVQQDITAR